MSILSKKLALALAFGIVFSGFACSSSPTPLPTPTSPHIAAFPTRTITSTPTPSLTSTPTIAPTVTPSSVPTTTLAGPMATLPVSATVTLTPFFIPTAPVTPTETLAPTRPPTRANIINLGACATVWEPGYYKLTTNIKTPEFDCFYIQSHDVVFDCDNHTIEGNNYNGYAFFVRKWGFPFQQTPANIEIKNCKVLHHRTGIFVGGANNVYIHHNDLSDNLDTVDKARFGIFLGMTEGGGLRLDTVKGGRAEFNTTNHEAIGIDVRDSDHIVVQNNTANGNSAWGISLLNTSNSQVLNNTARDNIRYCAWGDGTVGRGCDAGAIILQDGASHNVVSGNNVLGENGNGIFIKAHASRCGNDNLIQNNKLVDAVYNAIEFSFCDGNRIIGNEISGSYDAVWFGFSSNTEVRGNVIRNMNNHGIISFNSRGSLIAENQITNSREGIYFYWDKWDPKQFFFLTPTPDNYASRDNTIRDNTLNQNGVAGIHLLNSTANRLLNNAFNANGKTIWLEGKTDGTVTNNGQ